MLYAANNDGGYICIINVPTAMLDLPIVNPNSETNRAFGPFTERIPEVGTKVAVILEPLPAPKKGK